jgi:uncharacterized protein YbcV (DUF1398 family)
MNDDMKATAEKCIHGAEDGTMNFPEIVGTLMAAGFEGYAIDFRRRAAVYYLPDADSVQFPIGEEHRVAALFNMHAVKTAIREAQEPVPGFTYKGFCDKVMDAGCAGYIVSFIGRRVLYYGRTAETYVEYFPD